VLGFAERSGDLAMPANTVTLTDAATQLPELVARASEGEEIVIAKDERPLAKLVPFDEVTSEREFGQFRGRFHVGEDFDEPLPDDFWLGRRPS
jgi:prevent-host-death family protein